MKIVAVRDVVANIYSNPIYVPESGFAVRSFVDECANPESVFGKNPQDYELFELGEFDPPTGAFIILDRPKQLIAGGNFRRQ